MVVMPGLLSFICMYDFGGAIFEMVKLGTFLSFEIVALDNLRSNIPVPIASNCKTELQNCMCKKERMQVY
jgi:hypothetical protein